MSSFSNRALTSRAVSLSPSLPAKGDEFVPIVTERVGSSTVRPEEVWDHEGQKEFHQW